MNYILDTDVVSELRKRPGVADVNVVAWAARQEADALFLSVISVMELELGIQLVGRRDALQAAMLRHWFEHAVMTDLSRRTLPVTADIARRTAALHVPDPKPDRDAFIAGTALVHDRTVVTRNVANFELTGVRVLNPWQV